MNHEICQQLRIHFSVNLVDKINPPYNISEKIISKAFRMAGIRSIFPAFTRKRLETIKSLVEPKLDKSAALNFYHGSTPWLYVDNRTAYAIYLDCCFKTYMGVYHDSSLFNSRQLNDLYLRETAFLKKAEAVFFSSEWSLNETKRSYGLPGENFFVAGLGGGINLSEPGENTPRPYFLFVGLDFLGKGGDKVVEAFREVNKEFPQFTLKLVGEQPPVEYMNVPNVQYLGKIDKSSDEGMRKLSSLFAQAYCFVLPTSKDMTPLVLIEAAGVGCPVISMKKFGIPEMVSDNETGILLNEEEPLVPSLISAMLRFAGNSEYQKVLSRNGRKHVKDNFTWELTGDRIYAILQKTIKNSMN